MLPEREGAWLLTLGIEIDGQTLDLAPLLADLLRRDARWLNAQQMAAIDDLAIIKLRAPGGKRIEAPAGPLKAIVGAMVDLLTDPTRNQRKAARLSRTYDELEQRIERLMEQEELGKVRPELDGNQIAQALGIKPGPVLGRAYKYLLSVRLDEGPIGEDAARDRLLRWWAEQPESRDTAAG